MASKGAAREDAQQGVLQLRWKAFQLSVLVAFLFANVFFEWGIEGIAAPVMGGMLAYYLTGIIGAVLRRIAEPAKLACSGVEREVPLPGRRPERRIEPARSSAQRQGLPLQAHRQR